MKTHKKYYSGGGGGAPPKKLSEMSATEESKYANENPEAYQEMIKGRVELTYQRKRKATGAFE